MATIKVDGRVVGETNVVNIMTTPDIAMNVTPGGIEFNITATIGADLGARLLALEASSSDHEARLVAGGL